MFANRGFNLLRLRIGSLKSRGLGLYFKPSDSNGLYHASAVVNEVYGAFASHNMEKERLQIALFKVYQSI